MYFESRSCPQMSRPSIRSGRGSSRCSFISEQYASSDEGEPPNSIEDDKNFKNESLSTSGSTDGNEQQLVKELLPLQHGFEFIAPKYFIRTFSSLISPSLQLGLSNCGYDLLNLLGFFISAQSQAKEGEGSFGLALFFNSILIFGFFYSVDEKVGVTSAVYAGAKKYQEAKVTLWQGFLLLAILNLVYFAPLNYFSSGLLSGLGIGEEQAIECSKIMKRLYPLDLMRMFNETLMTYILALGTPNQFGLISAFNLAVSFVSGLTAFYFFDLGILSWWIARAVHEGIMFLMVVSSFYSNVDTKSKGFVSLVEILQGFSQFTKDCGRFVISLYSEWIGQEIALFFTGLTQDVSQIAAHSSMVNLAFFITNIGIGFSIVGRTRINILLGKGYHQAARNFFIVFLVGCLLMALLLSLSIYALSPVLVYLYTGGNPQIAPLFKSLLSIYTIFLPLDFLFALIFTVCRSVGLASTSACLNILLLVIYGSGMDYYLILVQNKDCRYTVANMYLAIAAAFSLLISKMLSLDWRKANLEHIHD